MSYYQLTWITPNLAVGYAPMSYAELDSIRDQGIDAIVNLCGEFCDLHEIEEGSGFEVYYLPIPDESAPDLEEMEKALEWLDEAIYLGKKVLVHCRHGIGRTGTFVTAYLLRRGLGLKTASKKMKNTRANPTNYSQWRLLKKYGRSQGVLKIREPSLESRHLVDLSVFFSEYEALVRDVEEKISSAANQTAEIPACGRDKDECCAEYLELGLMEAIYISNKINRSLHLDQRKDAINRAIEVSRIIRELKSSVSQEEMIQAYRQRNLICPLSVAGRCLLFDYRPVRCRIYGVNPGLLDKGLIDSVLDNLSREIFFALSGAFLEKKKILFSMADIVSGRFIQGYFHLLAGMPKPGAHAGKFSSPRV